MSRSVGLVVRGCQDADRSIGDLQKCELIPIVPRMSKRKNVQFASRPRKAKIHKLQKPTAPLAPQVGRPLGMSPANTAPRHEVSRRCQNCVSFDNGPLALQHYKAKRFQEMQGAAAKILAGEGVSPAMLGQRLGDSDPDTPKGGMGVKKVKVDAAMDKLGLNYDMGDQMIRQGRIGLCMKHKAAGDFVEYLYCCPHWTARVKPDDVRSDDKLAEEAKSDLGYDD
jgi:hypothetical protein